MKCMEYPMCETAAVPLDVSGWYGHCAAFGRSSGIKDYACDSLGGSWT